MFNVADYPEVVSGLRKVSSVNTISLEWTYQGNGSSPRIGVVLEIRQDGSILRMEAIGSEFTTSLISNLLPLSTYSFTLFVVNGIGRSMPSYITASTISLSM